MGLHRPRNGDDGVILGVVASGDAVPGAGSVLRASLDFAGGAASVNGGSVTFADIIDRPENVSPGFGVILGEQHPVEFLSGDLLTLLTSGSCTVLAEWYRIGNLATPFEITTADGGDKVRIEDNKGLGYFLAFDEFASTERDLDLTSSASGLSEFNVLHCAALTRTDPKLAISLDQASVISDTTPSTASGLTRAFIGGFEESYGPIILRRLEVYDALADEVLPTISATSGAFPVASNNDFANALPIEVGQLVYELNVGCDKETGEPDHAGEPGGKTLWRTFVAPASGNYKFVFWESTLASSVFSALYTGTAVDDLTEIVSDADTDWELTFTAVEGETYHLALQGGSGEEGFFSVSLAAV